MTETAFCNDKCQFISPPSAATVSRNPRNTKLNQKIISIKGRSTSHTVWSIVEVRWRLRLRLFQGGRLIAGRDNEPFRGQLHIKLRGNHSTPDWPLPNGPNQGSKVLGEKTAIYLQHIVHYLTLELKETKGNVNKSLKYDLVCERFCLNHVGFYVFCTLYCLYILLYTYELVLCVKMIWRK